MLSSGEAAKPKEVAEQLTKGYANHGFCINVDEAKKLGLNAIEITGEELDVTWEIHRLNAEKRTLQKSIRSEEVMERIKDLPPELLDKLPQLVQQKGEDDQI
jgi:molybdate-binding protein